MPLDSPAFIENLQDAVEHTTVIFPSNTNLICTFTAHASTNTWSSWAEIVDGGSTKLSAAFTANHGHITSIVIETISDNNAIYMFEIGWGSSHTLITSGRFAGGTKFQAANMIKRLWSPPFPVGELIYYRMKTETAVADFCTVHFRYHTD